MSKFKCLFEHEKEYILKVWNHYKSLEFHERVRKTADDLGILKTILLNRLSIYGTGFMSIDSTGEVKWVPFKKVIKTVKNINEQLNDSVKLKEDEL